MSVTDGNIDLVGPLASLSIEETNVELVTKKFEGEVDYRLFLGEHLLNGEVYFSVSLVSKKWHRTF